MSADLDRVIWEALTTHQAPLALGGDLARRFPADIAPFAAVREPTAAAFRALAALIPAGDQVALFTRDALHPPGDLQVVEREAVGQMVATIDAGSADAPGIALTAADAPDMRALALLTNPGPFRARTHELGRFVGIRAGGELVAMAGERMHPTGATEISAVCVHPDHRGRGHAAALVRAVAAGIRARGETPMLHVRATNASAIALYEKLGFAMRCTLHLAVLARPGDAPAAAIH